METGEVGLVAEARGFVGAVRLGVIRREVEGIDARLACRRMCARALRDGLDAIAGDDGFVDAAARDRTVTKFDIVRTPGHVLLLREFSTTKKKERASFKDTKIL